MFVFAFSFSYLCEVEGICVDYGEYPMYYVPYNYYRNTFDFGPEKMICLYIWAIYLMTQQLDGILDSAVEKLI